MHGRPNSPAKLAAIKLGSTPLSNRVETLSPLISMDTLCHFHYFIGLGITLVLLLGQYGVEDLHGSQACLPYLGLLLMAEIMALSLFCYGHSLA
ncbi:hypothetical protein SLA2020_010120 [Shorea laevis]